MSVLAMVVALFGANGCLEEPHQIWPHCTPRPEQMAAVKSTWGVADLKMPPFDRSQILPASTASSLSRLSNSPEDDLTAAPPDNHSISFVIFKAFREIDAGIAFKYAVYISAIRSKTSFDGT